jgi:hypothetical protein
MEHRYRRWILLFVRKAGERTLKFARVGEVGSIQLASFEPGGAFYRSAHRAVCWIDGFSPHRYDRLARHTSWVVNKRLPEGCGCADYSSPLLACFVYFRDFGDDDTSAGFVACTLIEQAFLIQFGGNEDSPSDERVVRIARMARRDALRFASKISARFPSVAEVVTSSWPEFSEAAVIAKAQKTPRERWKWIPSSK